MRYARQEDDVSHSTDLSHTIDLARVTSAESDRELLLSLYSVAHLVFAWYGIAFFLFAAPQTVRIETFSLANLLPEAFAVSGLLLAYVTVLRVPAFEDFQKRAKVIIVGGAACAVAALILGAAHAFGYLPSVVLSVIASVVGGYAIGVTALLALEFAAGFKRTTFAVCLCASMICGIMLFCTMSLIGMWACVICFIALSAAGSLCGVCYAKGLVETDNPERLLAAQAFDRLMLNSKTGWFFVLYGITVGLVVGEVNESQAIGGDSLWIAGSLGFAAGTAVSLWLMVKNQNRMQIGVIQRSVFPVFVVGLLPWTMVSENLAAVTYALIFAGCAMFVAFAFDTHCFLSKEYSVPPLYPIVLGSRSFVKGLLAGSLAAIATFAVSAIPDLLQYAKLAMIAILAVLVTFVREERDRTEGSDAASAASSSSVESVSQKADDEGASRRAGAWKRSCAGLVEQYSLTSREAEILELALKAYSAEHIAETLCISAHTAKTHVYHIYQKLRINSRKELLAIFEECLEKEKAATRHEAS